MDDYGKARKREVVSNQSAIGMQLRMRRTGYKREAAPARQSIRPLTLSEVGPPPLAIEIKRVYIEFQS